MAARERIMAGAMLDRYCLGALGVGEKIWVQTLPSHGQGVTSTPAVRWQPARGILRPKWATAKDQQTTTTTFFSGARGRSDGRTDQRITGT